MTQKVKTIYRFVKKKFLLHNQNQLLSIPIARYVNGKKTHKLLQYMLDKACVHYINGLFVVI